MSDERKDKAENGASGPNDAELQPLAAKAEEMAMAFMLARPEDPAARTSLGEGFLDLGILARNLGWSDQGDECLAMAASLCGETGEASSLFLTAGKLLTGIQAACRRGAQSGNPTWTAAPKPAPAPAAAAERTFEIPPFGVPADADPSLLSDFIGEATEHLEASDLHLMTLETDPTHREALNAVFRAFHTIKGVASFLALEGIRGLAHEMETLMDKVRQGSLPMGGAVVDASLDSVALLRRLVGACRGGMSEIEEKELGETWRSLMMRAVAIASGKAVPAQSGSTPIEPGMKLGEILKRSGTVSEEAVDKALSGDSPGKLGERLVQEGSADPKDVTLALRGQKNAGAVAVKETVKVDADRLDRLLDSIGELVIAESMIQGSPELKGRMSPALVQQMAQLDKITRELQEMATSLRMVPVRSSFQKMTRLARDLAKKAGKAVDFVTIGEDTELDKTVVDKISDPLVHMVRNAIDHGLESEADARTKAGKPAMGTVKLAAYHKGGNVCIEISDDGRGMDRERILAKARERGLLRDDAPPLTDREVWNFVFEAGFSTAAKVTDISGRGVGMDVVKRNIEALRGRIEIQSELGKGTTFSIWLPLTLAIIDGMVVRVAGERYVFPTLSVVRIVPVREDDVLTVVGKGKMLSLQGKLIPLFPLEGFFRYEHGAGGNRISLAIITESEGRLAAFPVDELLGRQQIVIKKLGEQFQDSLGLSGGAILADGCVGLILDVEGLIKVAHAGEHAHASPVEASASVPELAGFQED